MIIQDEEEQNDNSDSDEEDSYKSLEFSVGPQKNRDTEEAEERPPGNLLQDSLILRDYSKEIDEEEEEEEKIEEVKSEDEESDLETISFEVPGATNPKNQSKKNEVDNNCT